MADAFDLSQFDTPAAYHPDKPPTVGAAAWEHYVNLTDDEYWAERQGLIKDTGTELVTFHAGPYNKQTRLVDKACNEVIVPGCFADDPRATGHTDWPGHYIYRRYGTKRDFIYAGPTPQPNEEAKKRLILP